MALLVASQFHSESQIRTVPFMAEAGERKRAWVRFKPDVYKRALHLAVDADVKSFEAFMGDLIELGCDAWASGKRPVADKPKPRAK
jgi:hypothetical protein